MNYLIFLFFAAPLLLNAEYTKLEWSDCGSKELILSNVGFKPMPAVHPGVANLDLKLTLKRDVVGKLKTSFNIVRKVSGVNLPIRCYTASGVYVGSCSYDDSCNDFKTLLNFVYTGKCPEFLSVFGIDCFCPLNVKAGTYELINEELNLPDFSSSIFNFLAAGDFDIKVTTSDSIGSYGCFTIKFTVKPASAAKSTSSSASAETGPFSTHPLSSSSPSRR